MLTGLNQKVRGWDDSLIVRVTRTIKPPADEARPKPRVSFKRNVVSPYFRP